MEFITINIADDAAASFELAQANKIKTGLKNMPPPIFSTPERKPIIAPMMRPHNKGIDFVSVLAEGKMPINRMMGIIRASPKRRLYTLSSTGTCEPKKAKGIDVIKKGQVIFHWK
jgi:hypothetical protein